MPDPTDATPTRASDDSTLAAVLARGERLATADVLRILHDVAAVLDDLNGRGYFYGLLSPDAVYVGGDGRAELADAGTPLPAQPAYLAPEQRHSDRLVNGRADQYSLALIAYEMLSGRRRQAVDTDPRGSVAVMTNEVLLVPGRSLRPDLAAESNDVLRRAIARDPNHRFATAGEFISTLERCYTPTGAVAAVRSLGERLPPTPVLAAAGAVAFVALIGVAVATTQDTSSIPSRAAAWGRDVVEGLTPKRSTSGVQARGASRPVTTIPAPRGGTATSGGTSGGASSIRPVETGSSSGGGGISVPGVAVAGAATTTGGSAGGGGSIASTTSNAIEPGIAGAAGTRAAAGQVRVTVDEGRAAVIVDGLVRGTTPYVGTFAAGPHTVSVRGIGRSFAPARSAVTVIAGDTSDVLFSRVQP